MKDYPILFSAPMVRAILDGKKTQTRRVIKPEPDHDMIRVDKTHLVAAAFALDACRFGKAGDNLWVRETHLIVGHKHPKKNHRVVFKATNDGPDSWESGIWTPSIHMPRWASRITLEITEVRAQRLQEITEEDSRQEGIRCSDCDTTGTNDHNCGSIGLFKHLWDSLNTARGFGWENNPWVWAVSFRRVKP